MSPLSPYRFILRRAIGLEGIPLGGTDRLESEDMDVMH